MTRVNTNIGALNALKSSSDVNNRLSIAQLRLATGKRINSAADDAAGYSIAKKFNVRSEGLGQAINNIGSNKNLVSVAEGHLNNIVDILTQMKTKVTQAADDSLGTSERNDIDSELFALTSQIDLEVNQATWNSKSLLNGDKTNGDSSALFNFQIGAGNSSTNDTLKFDLLNESNTQFNTGNTGFTAEKLQLLGTGPGNGIDVSKSFANAGFSSTPDGTVTINGQTFTLSNYSTVAAFVNAVNVSAGVEFSYDGTNDKFYIRQNTPGIDLVISETGTNGFLTAAKIPVGTYAMPVSTAEVIPGAGTVDVTKSFADNGIPITIPGFLINGYGSSVYSTDTVQYVMGIINTMGVTISYDSSTDKFSIISTYQPPSATSPYVEISEIGDFLLH